MTKKILIRFGDMMLKGKNIGFFIKTVRKHIMQKLNDLEVKYTFSHDRIFIGYELKDEDTIKDRLLHIPGLYSFSLVYVCEKTDEDIIQKAIHVLDTEVNQDNIRIKIDTKRTDKSFPGTSLEITKRLAGDILRQAKRPFIVDVRTPDETLTIDIRHEAAYVYLRSIKAMGGFPYGTGGKGLLMMSGGIDSPVAAYLAMKQGIEVELIHFESTPMTPLESVQKVIDLSKQLAKFTPSNTIKLHLVPFTKLHEMILGHIFDPYIITVMRRMMYRIAEGFTKRKKILCLINGESVGQVASQTLQSMAVVEAVTKMPILRPVVTYDKQEIIDISKSIDTYEISIRPFNDCCSIYVPKSPATKPMEIYALKYEKDIDYVPLMSEAIEKTITIDIHEKIDFDIARYGFSVKESYDQYMKERSETSNAHLETK